MTAAVVWTVLWFVFVGLGSFIINAGLSLLAIVWDKPIVMFTGWALGLAWGVFAFVQFVLNLINLIQMLV